MTVHSHCRCPNCYYRGSYLSFFTRGDPPMCPLCFHNVTPIEVGSPTIYADQEKGDNTQIKTNPEQKL